MPKWCCCLRLQVGCYVVAGLFLMVQAIYIYLYATVNDSPLDDEKNKEYRKTNNTIWLTISVLFCLIGFAIILAAYLKRPLLLKILAVLVVAPSLIMLIKLYFEDYRDFGAAISRLIFLGIFIYCAAVLGSYAREIEHPDQQGTVHYLPGVAGQSPQYSYPRLPQRDHRVFIEDQFYPRSLRPLVNPFGTGFYHDQRGRLGYQFLPDFNHLNRSTNANRTIILNPPRPTTPHSTP